MRAGWLAVVLVAPILAGCFGGSTDRAPQQVDEPALPEPHVLPPEALNFEFGPSLGCTNDPTGGPPACVSFMQGPDADPVDGFWLPLDESYWRHRFTSTIDSMNGDSDCYYIAADQQSILGHGFNGGLPCEGTIPVGTAFLFLYPFQEPAQAMSVTFDPVAQVPASATGDTPWPRCEHPYPCGDEWPEDVYGPFGLKEVREIEIESHDGTMLRGWLMLPDTPAEVPLPTILLLSPYIGAVRPAPGTDGWWAEQAEGPYPHLLRAGYAVATVSVRGTGVSDGCPSINSPMEQKDTPIVVEWLAARPWSNGRIGMMGLSWPATTALQGFVSGTTALKAVVSGVPVPDLYQNLATPQGLFLAQRTAQGGFVRNDHLGLVPMALALPEDAVEAYTTTAPTRDCPSLAPQPDRLMEPYGDERDAAYWDGKRITDDLADGTAALLVVQGLNDYYTLQSNDILWGLFEGRPRHMLLGPWDHTFPHEGISEQPLRFQGWTERAVTWFDFWLRGIGGPPVFLETVEYYDAQDEYHLDTAWPPAEARREALYVGSTDLSPERQQESMRFRSVSHVTGVHGVDLPMLNTIPVDEISPKNLLCAPDMGTHAVAFSAPLNEDALLAGIPLAYLALESDQAASQIVLDLFDIGPDFACENGQPVDVSYLSSGGADLRFHQGNMVAKDFPIGTPTPLRIDFHSVASNIDAGHRLALLAWSGHWLDRASQPAAPMLTLHADGDIPSHIVLPFVEGTLGGEETTYEYPPRPFMPEVET